MNVVDLRNRIGLYGSYFLGMAGIGFTLPYLPLYLGREGLSDPAIGVILTNGARGGRMGISSARAARAGLARSRVGLWSARLGWRKPFLVVALATVAASTWLLRGSHGLIWIGFLVVLFAESGIGRAVVESLAGAEAAAMAPRGQVGSSLGALRFWKPIGIVLMTLFGSWLAGGEGGVKSILLPLAIIQTLAVVAALLIHEPGREAD